MKRQKEKKQDVIFREVQKPRQIWLWILILAIAMLMWFGFIKQVLLGIPFGDNPAPNAILTILWVVFGIVFPLGLLLGFVKLITEVRNDGLYVRFVPFHIHYKSFLFKDIVGYSNITYNSLARFGGYGIRFNFNGETAYNMGGTQGIEIQLRRNKIVVVGSQNPDELIKALNSK